MVYAALGAHLAAASGSVRMSFSEVEALVGSLPASARRHREWWANSRSHSAGRAWLDAGYRVIAADIVAETVLFQPANALTSYTKAVVPLDHSPADVAPGSSEEQKRAERAMIDALAAEIGVPLGPKSIRLSSGNRLAVDGVSDDPPVLCEAWAHQGPPKSAQRAKVAKDLLKLTFLASLASTPPRLILLFSDEAACAAFRRRSWVSDVIESYGVEIRVVELPPDLRDAVIVAQRRQYR
jgi:hypothetical protein